MYAAGCRSRRHNSRAETNHFTIRRIEFVGNAHTSDGVLQKRMSALQEGEKFSKRNLNRSLTDVSRLNVIYPVQLRDVVLRLERFERLVDVVVCFKERTVAKR
jgi:outer membrane protein assembly factor BamA